MRLGRSSFNSSTEAGAHFMCGSARGSRLASEVLGRPRVEAQGGRRSPDTRALPPRPEATPALPARFGPELAQPRCLDRKVKQPQGEATNVRFQASTLCRPWRISESEGLDGGCYQPDPQSPIEARHIDKPSRNPAVIGFDYMLLNRDGVAKQGASQLLAGSEHRMMMPVGP